ncbi:MAG: membrane dipeptidase [Clostridia bacterium]|nr:membrane dipeptidase [Clostridia bacterium]
MRLSLFDLHCDTAYKMLTENQPLSRNNFAISLENARKFEQYTQVMALWTDDKLDDEVGWKQAILMSQNLQKDFAVQQGLAAISTTVTDTSRPTLLLSVEDARILAGKLERVNVLYRLGVRILTPLWKGNTCIGGSHDTLTGLTVFGAQAIRRAASLGMILDISHASEQSAKEIFAIGEEYARPVIASHSNAYDICPVSRNLKKEQIKKILASNGVIGLNLHVSFLKKDGNAAAKDILPHVEYFLEADAQDALCLGCDMDGCELPPDISNLASLPHLAELMLQHNYPEKLIRRIFFENAVGFAKKYLT